MTRLLGASPARADGLIVVAALLHLHPGDNPHLWYDPAAMPALVAVLATHLARDHADPDGLELRQARLLGSLRALRARIDGLRRKLAGAPIAATEPVFGPMVQALGLQDTQARFQLAVMNGAEPRAGDIAAFQDDLRAHRVRALITNSQTSNPAVLRLVEIARQSAIPVVSVSETLPPGETYQAWLGAELDALEAALRQGRHA
jgi:zinc/manganese transport system substrate-binding protein